MEQMTLAPPLFKAFDEGSEVMSKEGEFSISYSTEFIRA
jgi:hypothetical protein